MPPNPPKDYYAQHRRPHLTASEVPSPVSFVKELYARLYAYLPRWIQDEIQDDVQEYLNMISSSALVRTTGDDVHCMYVLCHFRSRLFTSGANFAFEGSLWHY